MKRQIASVLFACVIGAGLLFTAYHLEAGRGQRNWSLNPGKGIYQGPPPVALSEDARAALRARIVHQVGPGIQSAGLSSASVGSVGRNVRPPETPMSDSGPAAGR
ncbi:MAG: hypothetical protein EA405_14675 [Rhodospirillales bacterium]|nr:MAG: hypothetical protein EA405_14675 [Rhodospirillales bacterium]